MKWEDGKPITCEDFKYGASRVFATDVITGGPNYLLTYLDIPDATAATCRSTRAPTRGRGQGCLRQGHHLRRQHDHLPLQEAVAGLPAGDRRPAHDGPVPPGQGPGRQVQLPDLLQRSLQARGHRGTRTRAARSSATTTTTRRPTRPTSARRCPDKINFDVGKTSELISDRLIANSGADKNAVTSQRDPAGVLQPDHGRRRGALGDGDLAVRRLHRAELPSELTNPSRSARRSRRRPT